MKKIVLCVVLFLCCVLPSFAYTAYPWINASSTFSGFTGSIGYTVIAADGTTIIAARTTTGIVETGGGTYIVANGITVPDGSAYVVRWDKSGTQYLGSAFTVANSYLGSIKAVTGVLQFDGSNYIKSDPQTSVTLAANQNVATIGGLSPPTHWNNEAITIGGIVTANSTQIGSQNVALDSNNLLKIDLEDIHNTSLTTAFVPANVVQFNGQNTVLDVNNLPKVADSSWNGSLITTAVPNTAAVTIAAYASNQDPGYLIGKHVVDGSITVNGLFAAQLASILGSGGNTFIAPTLTTTYKRQDNTTTAFISSTIYGAGVTPPVTSRTGTVGTLPN